MKRVFKTLVPLLMILICLCACSADPEEPVTTGTETATFRNTLGATVPVAENINDYPDITQPVRFIETVHEVSFNLKSYYSYGKTVASIESFEFENVDVPQSDVFATVKAKMINRGREDKMMISFNAYDENGELLRKNGFISTNLDDTDDGDSFEFLLIVPIGTTRVEFFDYNK